MTNETDTQAGIGPLAGTRSVARRRPALSRLAGRRALEPLALPAAWLLIIAVFGILRPDTFLTTASAANIFGTYTVPLVLTLALVLPLVCGEYDLSVAAVAVTASMTLALLNVQHHVGIVLAIAVALAVGAAAGLINGLLIVLLDLNSLIVTLGTSTLLQGFVLYISDSATVAGVDTGFVTAVIRTKFLGIPMIFYYGLGLAVVLWYVLQLTALGRQMLFVGRGPEVARLSGLPVRRLRIGAFVGSGLVAGVAGVLYAGTTGSADPNSGLTFLLPAFAAAFLGATGITPGRYNVWGSAIAVYFLATGITGLQLLGSPSYVQQLFYGGALVVAVAMAQTLRRRTAARTQAR